jgi:hypothetical protein
MADLGHDAADSRWEDSHRVEIMAGPHYTSGTNEKEEKIML